MEDIIVVSFTLIITSIGEDRMNDKKNDKNDLPSKKTIVAYIVIAVILAGIFIWTKEPEDESEKQTQKFIDEWSWYKEWRKAHPYENYNYKK